MNIETLREKVTSLESKLAERGDKKSVQSATKSGPVGIGIIKALLEHLEAQEVRIAELERKVSAK